METRTQCATEPEPKPVPLSSRIFNIISEMEDIASFNNNKAMGLRDRLIGPIPNDQSKGEGLEPSVQGVFLEVMRRLDEIRTTMSDTGQTLDFIAESI